MIIASVLLYVSMFFYCLPPIRQFKGRFFYFFLLLAVEDPLSKILVSLLAIPQAKVHFAFSFFLLLAVIKPHKFLKYFSVLVIPVVLFTEAFARYYNMSWGNLNGLRLGIGFLHFIIFIVIGKITIDFIRDRTHINLFFIMLLLYEATVVIKFIVYVISSSGGILFFFATTAFELLLCIFFILFRDDDPRLIMQAHK